MRNSPGKITWMLVVFVWAFGAHAQLDDLSKIKRLVNGRPVDISPAIQWHQEEQAKNAMRHIQTNKLILSKVRPLPTWGLVEGVKTNVYPWGGWVVTGRIDGQPARFVLRNPPALEFQEFTRLQAETAGLRAKRDAMLKNDTGTSEIVRSGLNLETARAFTRSIDERRSLNDEIREKSKGYNLDKPFPVRCFATRTGQTVDGMAVFDRGVIVQQPQAAAKPDAEVQKKAH